MDLNQKEHNGACHCGQVKFKVSLSNGLHTARRCDCTFCGMRGAIAVSAKLVDLELLAGEQLLTLYQFNSNTAKHYFCSVCGIYTHHQRRSDPNEYGINVACLENIQPFDFEKIGVYDGKNHPSDGNPSGMAGELHYLKSS